MSGSTCRQGGLWGTFEITADEAALMYSHFQSNRAGIIDRGYAELLGQREHAHDATNADLSELAIAEVAEGPDVRTGSSGSPQ